MEVTQGSGVLEEMEHEDLQVKQNARIKYLLRENGSVWEEDEGEDGEDV